MSLRIRRDSSGGKRGLPKALAAMAMAAAMLIAVEVAVQMRSYFKTGQSVLAGVVKGSSYVIDPNTGLRLLRPNHVSGGRQQVMQSNRYGLRSPDIDMAKAQGTFRVAVLGASSVMGAYARSNELTFPSLLEAELRERTANRSIEVINAGMVGLTLNDQALLFDRLIAGFDPDVVIVYPGFNDFATYCVAQPNSRRAARQRLVDIRLPGWLLSVEMLLKNTLWLREQPDGSGRVVDAGKLDIANYRRDLANLFAILDRHRVLMSTTARSYRREQPARLQSDLSKSSRFYNPCFDIDGLHTLYDRHNAAIVEVAGASGIPVLRLDEIVPGGWEFFVDGSHFSARGDRLVAASLAEYLLKAALVPAGPSG